MLDICESSVMMENGGDYKMKITNVHNLPDEIVTAIKNREYSKGEADYSATGLLQPPQLQVLTGWNYNNLTTDVSDSIWSLFGSAVHHILESAAKEDEQQLAEKRLYVTLGGIRISGMFDRYDKNLYSIDDYKVTNVWKATKGNVTDWETQLNIYNWLFKSNYPDIPVEKLRVHAILRDWSFREAKKSAQTNGDYPLSQVVTIELPVWKQFDIIKFLVHKLEILEEAKTATNASELAQKVPCSNDDRWAKPDAWAVFNPQKNYTRKLFTVDGEHMTIEMCEKEARLAVAAMQTPGYKAVLRRGENIRCENKQFCLVRDFCAQYKGITSNEVKSDVISVEQAAEGLSNDTN